MSKVRRYCFDGDDSTKYGIESALLIHHLRYWIDKNRSSNQHFHDGHWWTYQSAKGFTEIFPFWSEDQVHRLIKKLINAGILITAHYGSGRGNRSLWYAFKDESAFLPTKDGPPAEIPRNRDMDEPEDSAEPRQYFREIAESNRGIATSHHSYTDLNPDNKNHAAQKPSSVSFEEFWKQYPPRNGRKIDKPKALAVWKRLQTQKKIDALASVKNYSTACSAGETFAKDAHRWLRDESWTDWQRPPVTPATRSTVRPDTEKEPTPAEMKAKAEKLRGLREGMARIGAI